MVTIGDKMRKYLAFLIIGFVLMGCTTAKITPTGPLYPATSDPIKVFFHPPEVEYSEIGIVSVVTYTNAPWSKLIQQAQSKAAKCGANGLIIKSRKIVKAENSGLWFPDPCLSFVWRPMVTADKELMGIAIRISD